MPVLIRDMSAGRLVCGLRRSSSPRIGARLADPDDVLRRGSRYGSRLGGLVIVARGPFEPWRPSTAWWRDRQQPPRDSTSPRNRRSGWAICSWAGVVGPLGQDEWRVAVGAKRAVSVVGDPPGPAQHPNVELEQRA